MRHPNGRVRQVECVIPTEAQRSGGICFSPGLRRKPTRKKRREKRRRLQSKRLRFSQATIGRIPRKAKPTSVISQSRLVFRTSPSDRKVWRSRHVVVRWPRPPMYPVSSVADDHRPFALQNAASFVSSQRRRPLGLRGPRAALTERPRRTGHGDVRQRNARV